MGSATLLSSSEADHSKSQVHGSYKVSSSIATSPKYQEMTGQTSATSSIPETPILCKDIKTLHSPPLLLQPTRKVANETLFAPLPFSTTSKKTASSGSTRVYTFGRRRNAKYLKPDSQRAQASGRPN